MVCEGLHHLKNCKNCMIYIQDRFLVPQPASGGTKKDIRSPFGIQHGTVNARKQDVLGKIIILLFSAARQSVL